MKNSIIRTLVSFTVALFATVGLEAAASKMDLSTADSGVEQIKDISQTAGYCIPCGSGKLD